MKQKHTLTTKTKVLLLCACIVLLAAGALAYKVIAAPLSLKEKEVTLEINSSYDAEDNIKSVLFGDISDVEVPKHIDTKKLGKRQYHYRYKGKGYPLTIHIVDTQAPTFTVVPLDIDVGMEVSAESAVKDVKDATATTIAFKEAYDFSKPGKLTVCIVVTDAAGNKTEKETTATIVEDKEKPTLTGIDDITIYTQESFDLKKGITVHDNRDPKVTIKVDAGGFSSKTPGVYTITYTAIDRSGNTTKATRTITVKQRQQIGSEAGNSEKIVYLTFDDGPSANTKKILDILDRYDAKATFFVIGGQSSYYPLIKEAHDRGHTIALHGYSHDYAAIYSSVNAFFADLDKIGAIVKEQIGYVPRYIRFPGGSSNTISANYHMGIMTTLTQEVINRGYQYYDWNCDSTDAEGNNISVSQIVANAIDCSATNINILFHDAGSKATTVQALPQILSYYKEQGYRFEAISDASYVPHHSINN